MKKLCFALLVLFGLTACGFHPRSPAEFPPQLKNVYFSPERPYSEITIEMRALLNAMNATLAKNAAGAPLTLKITHDYFSYNRADIIDATLPSTMSFAQTATISVVDNKTKAIILTQTFTTSQSITLNANQVYTANSNAIVKQELNHQLLSLIYYWLISTNVKNTLNHATQPKTTFHKS